MYPFSGGKDINLHWLWLINALFLKFRKVFMLFNVKFWEKRTV